MEKPKNLYAWSMDMNQGGSARANGEYQVGGDKGVKIGTTLIA